MPAVFYTHYIPNSTSPVEIAKQEHLLGRELLSKGLESVHHISVSTQAIDELIVMSALGKPYFSQYPDIHFNISHCNGLVACVLDSAPIGIDVEMPGYFADILIQKALHKEEQEFLDTMGTTDTLKEEWFYRFWTLKEAYVKALGIGVDTDLKSFYFTFLDGQESFPVTCSDLSVSCFQTKLPKGHILSLCYKNNGEGLTLAEI